MPPRAAYPPWHCTERGLLTYPLRVPCSTSNLPCDWAAINLFVDLCKLGLLQGSPYLASVLFDETFMVRFCTHSNSQAGMQPHPPTLASCQAINQAKLRYACLHLSAWR